MELLKNLDLPSQLQDLLPCGYSYKLKKWTPFENKPNHFEAVILTNVYTEEEAQEWWHEFNIKSNTTMRVRATCPKTGKVNTFKIYLRCLHQGRAEKMEKSENRLKTKTSLPIKRNTNCPAGMIVAIRRHIKYSRSKMRDPVDPVHPCEIQIRFVHNHPTNSADSLRFRPVSKEAEEKLLSLYQIGHSPTSALEMLKLDLQMEHGPSFSQVVSDRYHCPDKSFCYRLYYKHFGKDYAASAKKDIMDLINAKILHYNSVLSEMCIRIGMSDTDYALAVCTPLMKRAHLLPQSGDMVYIETCESPGNKERAEHYILLLIAHTAAGGIPLGAILTTSKSVATLTLGFQLLKELLPEHAFFCRGGDGPHAFLTEESDSQKTVLNSVWSKSDVIICTFRILQFMWRWLWDEKHHVLKDHRLYLLYLIKTLLFASNETEMSDKYQALCSDNVSVHYPTYLQQMKCLWERRHLWGICFHRLLPLQEANNYYEAAVRALKDKVFEQTKTFNIVQLLNYIVTRLDSYYRIKLLDILHDKTTHIFRSHYPDSIPSHIDQEIKQVAGNYFLVPSEVGDGKIYTVDAELNICSCPNGVSGALCLHQYWIYLKMPTEMFKVGFIDLDFRQKLFVVALGTAPPVDTALSRLPIEIPQLDIPHRLSENCSNVLSETNNISSIECVFLENNSTQSVESITATANVLVSLQSNQEHISLSTNSSCTPISEIFVDSIADSSVSAVATISSTILSVGNNLEPSSNDEVEDVGSLNALSDAVSTLENIGNQQETEANLDTDEKMVEITEKFDDFCQRVKDGLKNQPKEFLPALEIMMKTLERKGYSDDLIVSGLSFFGVLSAPSLVNRARKKSTPSAKVTGNEIIPRVHGRQMITYGKRRTVLAMPDENIDSKVKDVVQNEEADESINDLSLQTSKHL